MADNKTLEDMERLFLLELLVDNVVINYEKIGLDACEISSLKQACVRFQFLNYPVLEICEEDFCNITEDYQKDEIAFKSGKSCLFSLRGIPPDIRCFEISTTVLRQKTAGSCLLLGRTRISLGSSFTNILTAMENDCSTGPIARTSKDTHPLLNEKGEIVGKITVFVRLSCFGKMIITQFQVGGEENKSFLFKGVSDTKALSDLGPGEQSTILSDPFAPRGTPGGEPGLSAQSEQFNPQAYSAGVGYPDIPGSFTGTQQLDQNNGAPLGMSGDVGLQGLTGTADTFQGMGYGMPGMSGSLGMMGTPGNTPSNIFGMPENMADMPATMQGMPAPMQGMSGAFSGRPGAFPGMTGALQGMPGSLQGMPGSLQGMPGSLQGMPINMSGMQGVVPGMTGGMPPESEDLPDKNYKEIGVEINGHSLNIKIPRREKKPKSDVPQLPFCGKVPIATSESESESSEEEESTTQQQPQQIPGIEFCGCDYPLPPGFSCPPPPAPPKKKKKKKKPKCPLELQGNYCMKPDCPMGYPSLPSDEKKPGCPQLQMPPGAVGVKGEQVVFQMPSGRQGNLQGNPNAYYNIGGNVDTNLQKVQMMSDADAAKSVVPDPMNDVFLLKVGKKNIATERRAKMEVEIKSPRKEEIKLVDQQTQYLESDVGPVEDKGKKGGKVGKGAKAGGKGGKVGAKAGGAGAKVGGAGAKAGGAGAKAGGKGGAKGGKGMAAAKKK